LTEGESDKPRREDAEVPADSEPGARPDQGSPPEGDGDQIDVPSGPPRSTWAGKLSADDEPDHDDAPGAEPEVPEGERPPDVPDADLPAADPEVGGEETVEADTPKLADREAAREAALAGLRARTAEHAAKQPVTPTATPPPAAAPPAPSPAATPPAPASGSQGDTEPPAAGPPGGMEGEESPASRAMWSRFVAGSLLILVSMATATAVSLLVYLTDLAKGLGGLGAPVQSQLAVPDPGKPQTILILGSDRRPKGQAIGARSDTTILLRVAADQITVLSIPRDLKVNIPGHGIDKFNAAYSYGGPKLTLKVVKQLTGLDNINHVVNVDFTGFADAVNSIGCVYVDVDHHYFHSNAGLAPLDQYAEINIPAGYQRMCGLNALQYVRYRHDDNDLVRSARQQNFLREARQELPPETLIADRSTLTGILKKYVTSDIEDPITLVSLGKLFLAARSAPVIQVHFPANLGGPTASYVTASQSAIQQAVREFEGQTPSPPSSPAPPSSSGGGSKSSGGSKKHPSPPKPAPPPLIDSTASGQQFAAKLAATKTKSGKPMLDFPVYYPTLLAPGSTITADSRAFPIDGPGSDVYHGYKLVAELPTDGYTGYYGVSGTDWTDPPILAHPDETKTIDGRDYLESWDGSQLRLVGWKTNGAAYWIDNTLLNVLTPGQMLGIAQSMRSYTG
jgi:polyisoprenyl-teichoic acid--peptidoglycan teichoic acid transferase